MNNKIIGKTGEEIAQAYLRKKGYEIVETNYRYSKMSEIDIIAKKNNVLHFVEVKTRTSNAFGSPLEAITKKKLNSIYSCAKYYLMNCKKRYDKTQIDAISIILKDNKEEVEFIEDISLD